MIFEKEGALSAAEGLDVVEQTAGIEGRESQSEQLARRIFMARETVGVRYFSPPDKDTRVGEMSARFSPGIVYLWEKPHPSFLSPYQRGGKFICGAAYSGETREPIEQYEKEKYRWFRLTAQGKQVLVIFSPSEIEGEISIERDESGRGVGLPYCCALVFADEVAKEIFDDKALDLIESDPGVIEGILRLSMDDKYWEGDMLPSVAEAGWVKIPKSVLAPMK